MLTKNILTIKRSECLNVTKCYSMKDQLNQIEAILSCPECSCLFNMPVILPCGDRICRSHLVNRSMIECNVCLSEYPTVDFPADKLLMRLLAMNIPGTIAETINGTVIVGDQHKNAMLAFEQYEMLIERLELLVQDPHNHLYEQVSQCRNRIDLDFERELISVASYDRLLAQLTKFEQERTDTIGELIENYLKKLDNFKSKAISKKARLDDLNENEKVWLELINEFEADSLRLQYAINDFKSGLLGYKRLELVDINDVNGFDDYNSFTNQFNIESIDMNKYFNLVFSCNDDEQGDRLDEPKRLCFKSVEGISADRTRASVQLEIKNFSEFMQNNDCVSSGKFLFKNLLWYMSVKYTVNSNLSFYIHLCDTSIRESDVYSIKASIKPLEINQDFYSFNDLYEKTLEAEFSAKKRSNGFGKYYFSNVDWLSENMHNLENDSITFEATLVDNQEIELMKEANSIIADLNPYNIDQLLGELDISLFDSEDRLKCLVCLVYENAFVKYNFSSAFVQLSVKLADLEVALNKDSRSTISFRQLLAKRCQRELETSYQFDSKLKRIRFFGELFKAGLLDAMTIRKYIQDVIDKNFCEENLKCLSRLLAIGGKDLMDANVDLEPFLVSLKRLVAEEVSFKCTHIVSDLYDLKSNQWSVQSNPNEYELFKRKFLNVLPTRFSTRFKKGSTVDTIEIEFTESDLMSRNFIRAMICCICHVSFQSSCFDKNLFDQLTSVLVEFIDRQDSFQMEILLAIEDMGKESHPEVVITKIFNQLSNQKVVSSEVLYHWKNKSDESMSSEINELYERFYNKS